MSSRISFAMGLGVLFVAETLYAKDFACAPLLPSTAKSPTYRLITGQARCEGFFDKTVSQAFIELVSLTRGLPPSAVATPAGVLEVHANVKGPVRLVVQPQRSSPFYRVDAAMQGGQILSWDPAPMLKATGLQQSDLGFVAVSGSAPGSGGTLPIFAPLSFALQAQQDQRVYAVIRVSVEVSSVAWRAYRKGPAGGLAPVWVEMPNSQRYAWQRITVPLELPVTGQGLMVDVQAVSAVDSQFLPLLRFSIAGRDDDNKP